MFPDHFQALTWLGILDFRTGDLDAAVAYWERGIEAAGGSHPEIERLIAEARRVASQSPESRPPVQAAAPVGGPVDEKRTGVSSEPPAPVTGAYSVRVALAAGAVPPPGTVLYVAVRDGGGGPPIAVRRIDRPVFPLDVVVSQTDSMMGQPLPESATVTARLDTDGSVATRSPGDLEAAGLAEIGGAIELMLAGN